MSLSPKATSRLQSVLIGDVTYDPVVKEIIDAIDKQNQPNNYFTLNFDISDWQDSNDNDTYFIQVSHNLNTESPTLSAYESNSLVLLHKIQIIDLNNLK